MRRRTASVLDAVEASLDGDPWRAQEAALHFLESTGGIAEPHILWLRRLAAVLLANTDFPDETFIRRLLRVVENDPSLPVLVLASDMRMRIAPPQKSQKLGTGLVFHVTRRKPVAGRFAFAADAQVSPNPESAKELWQDGQLLAAGGTHPERVSFELPLACPDSSPLLLEIAPEGPAVVQTSDGFFASTERAPGAESRIWRLIVPGAPGRRVLAVHLAALPDPRRPRIRLLPSSACSFDVFPVPARRLNPPNPEPAELALLVQAAESIAVQSAQARSILERWNTLGPRPALVDFLHVSAACG
jgi:hypothetical protein